MFIRKANQTAKLPPPLSAEEILAKTYGDKGRSKIHRGRSVFEHCLITGMVAKRLASIFSASGRKLFSSTAFWYAACHDAGKINPPFYLRIENAWKDRHPDYYQTLLRALEISDNELAQDKLSGRENSFGRHAGLSAATLLRVYPELHQAAQILGLHHGFCPDLTFNPLMTAAGGESWEQAREELIEKLRKIFSAEPYEVSVDEKLLFAGLTSVSDWIASGSIFNDPSCDYAPLIDTAFKENNLIPPKFVKRQKFEELFSAPNGQPLTANPVQNTLHAAVSEPGIYILQAPMGLGKTEAALWAAYRLLSEDKARGFYFALPTRLTATQIYWRTNSFLKRILAEDSPFRDAFLLHGTADQVLAHAGAAADAGGDFFSTHRRKLLAPFAVGTVDQALLGVLPCKFSFVRLFALADKVVIFDEVHSYDLYVSTLLRALIQRLVNLGATVIILSATLTSLAAQNLLGCSQPLQSVYPALISKKGSTPVQVQPLETGKTSTCSLTLQHSDDEAMLNALEKAERGEQVLWIENTVADAQEICLRFKALAAHRSIDLGLLHSRFRAADREQLEDTWVSRLGKEDFSKRSRGAVLIGTQILEQSLDIDADALFTRLAPLDFILQRIGRLWRFADTPRPAGSQRSCTVLLPKADALDRDASAFGRSAYIYAPYVLARTMQVLEKCSGSIALPADLQPLLESVYAEKTEDGLLAQYKQNLIDGWPALHQRGQVELEREAKFALSGTLKISAKAAQTRLSTYPSCSCLLLESPLTRTGDGALRCRLWHGCELYLPEDLRSVARCKLTELQDQLQSSLLQVPMSSKLQKAAAQGELLKDLEETILQLLPELRYTPMVIAVVADDDGRLNLQTDFDCSSESSFYYTTEIGFAKNIGDLDDRKEL